MTSRSNGANTSAGQLIPASIEATPLSQYTQLVSINGLGAFRRALPQPIWCRTSTRPTQLFHIFDQTVFPAVLPSSAGACAVAPGCGAFLQGTRSFGSSNGTVREDDIGGWFQVGWDTTFYGVPFRGNIGGRYVETTTDRVGHRLQHHDQDLPVRRS